MSRSLAETQVAQDAARSDPVLLPVDAIRVTPNERLSPLPPVRINVTPNERISPSPPARINVTPNERISSPLPKAMDPQLMDVDVTAKTAQLPMPAEKNQSKTYRVQVALPDPPLPESQRIVDWGDIWMRLRWPAQIMLLSLAIIVAELYYPRMTSSALESFGVRPMWAAAAVATVALSWACVRLFFGR
jgi:hypothetical protein